jgi:hypothetical protein
MALIYTNTSSVSPVYNTTSEVELFSNSFSSSGVPRPTRYTLFGSTIENSSYEVNYFFSFYINGVQQVGIGSEVGVGGFRYKCSFTVFPTVSGTQATNAELIMGASGGTTDSVGTCNLSFGGGSQDLVNAFEVKIGATMSVADPDVGIDRYLVVVEEL